MKKDFRGLWLKDVADDEEYERFSPAECKKMQMRQNIDIHIVEEDQKEKKLQRRKKLGRRKKL